MKKSTCLIFIFSAFWAKAQTIEKFFDYNRKPCEPFIARYYAVIEFKDSLWFRQDYFIREKKLQMKGSYKDSICKQAHGPFVYYHANGRPESYGNYENGKRQGVWIRYHQNGMMRDSTFYVNGKPLGTSLGWHANGYPSDSSVYDANGRAIKISWFDNGSPSSGGYLQDDKFQGKWVFYHLNGNKSAIETYDRGKLLTREYFDENGTAIADTTNRDRHAEFKGGAKGWKKYMENKMYFPDQYKITGGDKAIVVVNAVIDEEGNVTEVELSSPFHPEFDRIAVNMMKGSPKWIPAINHNRRVKFYVRQPVTFAQSE